MCASFWKAPGIIWHQSLKNKPLHFICWEKPNTSLWTFECCVLEIKKRRFFFFSVCHSIWGNNCFSSGFYSWRKLQSSNIGRCWQWSYSLFLSSLCQNTFMSKHIYNYIATSFSPPPAKSNPEAQAGQRLSSRSFFGIWW